MLIRCSSATGRRIAEAASATVKRIFLELGGKSAHIVLDDVDDIGAAVASPCFMVCTHGGQGCATSTRLLLPRSMYEEGWFFRPTLLADVTNDMEIAREEIFGPVLVAIAYDDVDDAVAIANDSIYGLSGAVVGGDVERAKAVGRPIRTGTMSINGAMWNGVDVPFGGYEQSGVGRESGVAGLEEYLEIKALAEPASPVAQARWLLTDTTSPVMYDE